MSKGKFNHDMHCPGCGVPVGVVVSWYDYPGTREDPPDNGFDIACADACDACSQLFDENVVEQWCDELYECWPDKGDGQDYEPDYDYLYDERHSDFGEDLDD